MLNADDVVCQVAASVADLTGAREVRTVLGYLAAAYSGTFNLKLCESSQCRSGASAYRTVNSWLATQDDVLPRCDGTSRRSSVRSVGSDSKSSRRI